MKSYVSCSAQNETTWSSPAALGQDTTVAPGWWLEPDTSQRGHHPALPAHPHHAHRDTGPSTVPANLGSTSGRWGSSSPARPFRRGLDQHEAVKGPTGCSSRTRPQHPTAARASPRDRTTQTASPPSNEAPLHPHLLPRSHPTQEAHPQLAGERPGNRGAAATCPHLGANHLKMG